MRSQVLIFGPRKNLLGFSLLEILFGLSITAILLGMTTISFRKSIEQEGPRGLANTLASDLRSARVEAQRSGKMVAVCFPSEEHSNSLSRSAFVRRGEQRGHILRTLSYGNEYDATIFLGTWPGAELITNDVPISWAVSTRDEVAIYFRPDGTAFSNDLPAVEGSLPIVVASSFQGTFSGPDGTVTAASNPHTVWVSATGSVSLESGTTPQGRLPQGESALTVATLKPGNEPPEAAPLLRSAQFYPKQIDEFGTATLGQNYVSIHPNQKAGSYLEYGIATIDVRATDSDGGPLTYKLEATASSGEEGKFTVSDLEGQMNYIFDPALGEHVWHALISWRPPPGAPPDLVYDLKVTLADPQGNTSVIESGVGLFPRVSSLPPSRIVMCSTAGMLYITDLDGSNQVRLTYDGAERKPFFSADGSRVFSFFKISDDQQELRSRPADGSTAFERLARYNSTSSQVFTDPTFTYAAVLAPNGTASFPWGEWVVEESSSTDSEGNTTTSSTRRFVTGTSEVAVKKVSIINLMSQDPAIAVTGRANGSFEWAGNQRYVFRYDVFEALARQAELNDYPPRPGYEAKQRMSQLEGYPARVVDFPGPFESAQKRIYNPAVPSWYLEVEENSVKLKGTDPVSEVVVYNSPGGIELDADLGIGPTWSADGRRIAFVSTPGAGAKVVSIRVLDEGFAALSAFVPNAELSIAHASRAQLSPTGRWVYYLKNDKVFLVDNVASATPIDISGHIGAAMEGYVVSP